jgi:DNA-binding CsgD family transcriptional regulator
VTGPARELTARQLDVLNRIADGQPWTRIGADLGITIGGVGSINKQILTKLGAVSAPHAVLLACRAGLLDGRPRTQRHGDHAGYTQHQKRGEEACQACKAGERAYQVQRRQRRRETADNHETLEAAA